jgi:hypothetical protein
MISLQRCDKFFSLNTYSLLGHPTEYTQNFEPKTIINTKYSISFESFFART